MMWTVKELEPFSDWFDALPDPEKVRVAASVILLKTFGVNLRFPHSSGISGSRHSSMRELRVQAKGKPYRILYTFDPERAAVMLIAGNKTGDERWYDENVPKADSLFDKYLAKLAEEKAKREAKANKNADKGKKEKKR
jgi:hypothetical protein